ncbi:MAG TPA: hypothetical protein DCW90_09685 [Lachnospiraceae bacterium]|nr:hypothetical protein [Lachnospiraceae bacterium]
MAKKPESYFISDFHFGDESIIKWERTQFENIKQHDLHILMSLLEWYANSAEGSTLWVLGDFGNVNALRDFGDTLRGPKKMNLNYVSGNHDKHQDIDKFKEVFDNVYEYPIYLSHKLVVSHEAITCDDFCVNIHGHNHGSYLDSPNHICVSCNDIGYKPFKISNLQKVYQKLPPRNMKFLWEPFADKYVFKDKSRKDIVCDPLTGKIDVAASRVLQKSMRDKNWNLLKN